MSGRRRAHLVEDADWDDAVQHPRKGPLIRFATATMFSSGTGVHPDRHHHRRCRRRDAPAPRPSCQSGRGLYATTSFGWFAATSWRRRRAPDLKISPIRQKRHVGLARISLACAEAPTPNERSSQVHRPVGNSTAVGKRLDEGLERQEPWARVLGHDDDGVGRSLRANQGVGSP